MDQLGLRLDNFTSAKVCPEKNHFKNLKISRSVLSETPAVATCQHTVSIKKRNSSEPQWKHTPWTPLKLVEVTKSSFDPSVFVVIICDLSDTKSVETKLEIWLFWNQDLWDIFLHLFLWSFKASSPAQAPADRFGSVFVRKSKPLAGHGEIYTIHGDPDDGPADLCCWPRIFPPHLDTQITKKKHQLTRQGPSSTHKSQKRKC